MPQPQQKAKQAICGKFSQPAAHQRGDLWLVDPEALRNSLLGKRFGLNEKTYRTGQLRLGQSFFRVRNAKIGEDVAAADFVFNIMQFLLHCVLPIPCVIRPPM